MASGCPVDVAGIHGRQAGRQTDSAHLRRSVLYSMATVYVDPQPDVSQCRRRIGPAMKTMDNYSYGFLGSLTVYSGTQVAIFRRNLLISFHGNALKMEIAGSSIASRSKTP